MDEPFFCLYNSGTYRYGVFQCVFSTNTNLGMPNWLTIGFGMFQEALEPDLECVTTKGPKPKPGLALSRRSFQNMSPRRWKSAMLVHCRRDIRSGSFFLPFPAASANLFRHFSSLPLGP